MDTHVEVIFHNCMQLLIEKDCYVKSTSLSLDSPLEVSFGGHIWTQNHLRVNNLKYLRVQLGP